VSPRAREDSVRPRLCSGAGARPLNFAVRRHIGMSTRFEVYSHSHLVGSSELEHRDPSMGVAFGRFVPTPEYSKIQVAVRATLRSPNRLEAQAPFQLAIRTPQGALLHDVATIADGSSDDNPTDIELELLGVPDYLRHFPETGGDA
jgi:hypothetical protein